MHIEPEIVGVPESTIKTRFHRAGDALRGLAQLSVRRVRAKGYWQPMAEECQCGTHRQDTKTKTKEIPC